MGEHVVPPPPYIWGGIQKWVATIAPPPPLPPGWRNIPLTAFQSFGSKITNSIQSVRNSFWRKEIFLYSLAAISFAKDAVSRMSPLIGDVDITSSLILANRREQHLFRTMVRDQLLHNVQLPKQRLTKALMTTTLKQLRSRLIPFQRPICSPIDSPVEQQDHHNP